MITWAVPDEQAQIDGVAKWVAGLIWPGKKRDFGHCRALAVIDNERLIAGMIYHNFDEDARVVEISGAGTDKRWLTRETLRVMFAIPFRDWACQAIVMRVSDQNAPLHRMLKAYGFEHYRIPRLRGRDEAENVFVLTDEAWSLNKFNRKNEVR